MDTGTETKIKRKLLKVQIQSNGVLRNVYIKIFNSKHVCFRRGIITSLVPFYAYLPEDDYSVETKERVTVEEYTYYICQGFSVAKESDLYTVVLKFNGPYILDLDGTYGPANVMDLILANLTLSGGFVA